MNAPASDIFTHASPAKELVPFVSGYWFVRDLHGVYDGQTVTTLPNAGAVISFSFGSANRMKDGTHVIPRAILGAQTRPRQWLATKRTDLVMANLTPPGMARLFPGLGRRCVDSMLCLDDVVGSAASIALQGALEHACDRKEVVATLDDWFRKRLSAAHHEGGGKAAEVISLLCAGHGVNEAAASAGLSRRHLHRLTLDTTGLSPRAFMQIRRLQKSVTTVQKGSGDALEGFSDQSHQIRNWKRYLGITPVAYARSEPTEGRAAFSSGWSGCDHAHYL